MSTRRVGDGGEAAALRYLRRLGYRLLARNYRTPRGEIDLILRRGDDLVFVEVKLRSGTGFGHPLEAVSERQRARVRAAAEEWLAAYEAPYETARFDVVGILGSARGGEILHVEDAF